MNKQKETTPAAARVDEKKWYSLRVISGKEKKIKERIDLEIERSNWKEFIFSVIVPTEKVYKIRNGKKVVQERNLLPGYILIEAYGYKLNGDVAKMISDIPNVIHFLGKETPIPMTQTEANRLLGKVDDSSEAGETMAEPFLIGETVKIIDGAFADFVGDIQEVNEEKKKLKVVVKIFGRGTEMELNFMQVEKIS
ncbi:MAG: transcription termination/antitermination factor NusG [Saprospiraceae bacterium]|nr:transcription termination/antitermination factor NusG [Saprospiraceae bacterium]